jgi:release factor glutamine methyltransferase
MAAMTDSWTILGLLEVTKTFFEKKGITGTARLDAELLLAHVLGCRRIELYVRFEEVVVDPQLSEFRRLVAERADRKPVKQILGRCEFISHEFEITPDVLTPRPETETLVEEALGLLDDEPLALADIGTGSGAIAVSIALARPAATVYATDASEAALAVAARNVEHHDLADRVRLLVGDLFEPLATEGLAGKLDAIVSNPPYIAEAEFADLMPEVSRHEPRMALMSDEDGLYHTRRILEEAPTWLRPGGWLLVELSAFAAERARTIAEAVGCWTDIRTAHDLSKVERVLIARKKD